MRQVDLAIGWLLVILGTVHNFVTAPMRFPTWDSSALWYVSGGITMWLIGAMNLLRGHYGEVAPDLRRVCFVANLVMTAFSITYAAVTGPWRNPPAILLLALCAGATLMTVLHRPTNLGTKRDWQ